MLILRAKPFHMILLVDAFIIFIAVAMRHRRHSKKIVNKVQYFVWHHKTIATFNDIFPKHKFRFLYPFHCFLFIYSIRFWLSAQFSNVTAAFLQSILRTKQNISLRVLGLKLARNPTHFNNRCLVNSVLEVYAPTVHMSETRLFWTLTCYHIDAFLICFYCYYELRTPCQRRDDDYFSHKNAFHLVPDLSCYELNGNLPAVKKLPGFFDLKCGL